MFQRLIRLVKTRRSVLVLSILLGWLAGLAATLQAWFLSQAISRAFLGREGLDVLWNWLLWLLGSICLRSLAVWGSEWLGTGLAITIKGEVRRNLIDHMVALGPGWLQGQKAGELSVTTLEAVDSLEAWFAQFLPQAALAAAIPLTLMLLVFPLDPFSGLVFLLTAPLLPLFMWLIGKAAESATRRQWQTLNSLSAYLLDVIQGLKTLKALGSSRRQVEQIRQASDRYREVTLSVLRVAFLSSLALELLSTLGTALVAVSIGLRLLHGQIGFQTGLFILVLAPEIYLPIRLLGQKFHASTSGLSAARRIFAILDEPLPAKPKPAANIHLPRVTNRLVGNIRFNSVNLTFPQRSLPAVQSISFEMPAGKVTAVVGRSGGGKSTLATLLLRFIEPDQGEIQIGDQPLTRLPVSDWRRNLAWVPQDPTLFRGTLADNLRLARPGASPSEMERACSQADLLDFVTGLPQGFNTQVGEGGLTLSAGQAQRLALARAFLKDAPLLVLDEPTSNLDPLQEQRLVRSLQVLMQDRTTLLIAHRLNTVRQADQVLVLDGGRLVEQGTHESLVRSQGPYASLLSAVVTR